MKKRIEYNPTGINNFHNSQPINVMVDPANTEDEMYLISTNQARRIQKHFCGITDCRCPGGAVQQLDAEGAKWGIYKMWCADL